MNLADKLEFKKDVLLSVGVKVEEVLERAEQQAHETRGGKVALRSQAKNLLAIIASTDQEVEKSIPDLDTLKIVKGWMSKMVIATENAANHLENVELQTRGEIIAHKKMHDIIKKLVGDADQRIDEINKAVAAGIATIAEDGTLQIVPGGNGRRHAGMHPGVSIKDQRLAEEVEVVEKKDVEEEVVEKKVVEEEVVEKKVVEEEVVEKKVVEESTTDQEKTFFKPLKNIPKRKGSRV